MIIKTWFDFHVSMKKIIDKGHNVEADVEWKAQNLDVTRAFYWLHKSIKTVEEVSVHYMY